MGYYPPPPGPEAQPPPPEEEPFDCMSFPPGGPQLPGAVYPRWHAHATIAELRNADQQLALGCALPLMHAFLFLRLLNPYVLCLPRLLRRPAAQAG